MPSADDQLTDRLATMDTPAQLEYLEGRLIMMLTDDQDAMFCEDGPQTEEEWAYVHERLALAFKMSYLRQELKRRTKRKAEAAEEPCKDARASP